MEGGFMRNHLNSFKRGPTCGHTVFISLRRGGLVSCLRALQSDKWMMLWNKIWALPDVG